MQPKATILVVDDNADNRALAQAALEDEGYQVLLATGGDEAISVFQSGKPDCLLLDVRMPGTDGFAVCAKIRTLPGGTEVPIVFLTALRDVDTFDRALRAGGDDFLTKPVRPTELVVRIQAALKLRRMSAELRENFELVRRQRDDLMRLQLQKEQLTSFVVHDLKNPVTSMDLLAQSLLADPELSPRARESAKHVRSEARALLRLVLNLLDISKSEEGQLAPRLSEVPLDKVTADVLDELELKAQTSEVKLARQIDTGPVKADPDLLRRMLENLVDNAIRHAPEQSVVRVTAERSDGAVELRVADTGPGIPPEMREAIFERFVQVEGSSRTHTRSGRGLGLAFCKLVALAHGGKIWVEDGKPGSIFCFRWPG